MTLDPAANRAMKRPTPKRDRQRSLFRPEPKPKARRPVHPTAKMVEVDPSWIFSFIAPTDAEFAAFLASGVKT